jgi:superfamily II DNA or RNA helicase
MSILKLKVNNVFVMLDGPISETVLNTASEAMSYLHQGQKFIQRGKFGWDGKIRLLNKGTFPVGLLSEMVRILKEENVPFEIEDYRSLIKNPKSLSISKDSGFVPRDYQKAAVNAAISSGSGIIKAATGAGKTSIISMISGYYNANTVIYVIGVELLYQMKSTLNWLYPELEVGVVGDGKCDVKKITIATIWSAAAAYNKKIEILDSDLTKDTKKVKDSDKSKIRKMVEAANVFILDECQFAAAKTVQFLHRESKSAGHRFLFSASPWRDTGDDILIEAVGGKRIFDLNASKIIRKGFLVKPKIYFVDVPAIRNVGKTYHEVYSNYIVNNDERNDLIIKSAKKLIEKGKRVLILVVRVNHGEILLEKIQNENIPVDFLDGQKSTQKRMDCIKKIKNGDIQVLIASKIFDQGVDIPELDALILAGSGKSSGRALQRIGRVIRKYEGKEIATVVEFMDNAKYLRDHSLSRMNVYATEPEFEIILQKQKDPDAYVKRKKINWT